MKSSGLIAEQIKLMFQLFRDREGLARALPEFNGSVFRRSKSDNSQTSLF